MRTIVCIYSPLYPKEDVEPYLTSPEKVQPWDTVTSSHGVKVDHGEKANIYNFRTPITITVDSRR